MIQTYWYYIVRIKNTNDTRIEKKKSRTRSERDDDGFGFTLFLVVVVVIVVIIIIVLPPVITKNKKKYFQSKTRREEKQLETQRALLCLVFPPGFLPGRHIHTRAVVFPAGHLDARLEESVLSTDECLCDARCCARFSSTQLILLFLCSYFWTEFFFSARKLNCTRRETKTPLRSFRAFAREKVSPSKHL